MELDLFETRDPVLEVLEYARLHGLCKNYLTDLPSFHDVEAPSDQRLGANLDGLMHLSITDPDSELIKERLTVNKEAALLLKAVHSLQQQDDVVGSTILPWRLSSQLRQEVPLLRSDHELDLQTFGNPDIPSFSNLRIPMETTDIEKDEGLEWPSRYQEHPANCDRELAREKISIPKDVLLYLQDTVRDPWTQQDRKQAIAEGSRYQRNKALEPLTPPLLPSSPPLEPYIPSSPGNRLELLPESTNSTAAELEDIETRVMKDDAPVLSLRTEGSDDSLLFGGIDTAMLDPLQDYREEDLFPVEKRKRGDLYVEGPLTPLMFTVSPLKKMKSVSFTELLHEYIPVPPSTFESGNDVLSSQDSFSAFFEPYAEQADKMVAKEKLVEADTTKRVDVPDLDFTSPLAPWMEFSRNSKGKHMTSETELDAQMKFLLRIKREKLKSASSWHGLTKLERELHWSPFPTSMATVKVEEKLHGEEVLGKLLNEVDAGNVVTSSTDLWKRDGLRILEDDDDSDEELEPAEYEEPTSMESLIRKRKLEIDEEDHGTVATKEGPTTAIPQVSNQKGEIPSQANPNLGPRPRELAKKQSVPLLQKEPDSSLMFGGMFSASSALHKFMTINGKQPLSAASEVAAPPKETPPLYEQILRPKVITRKKIVQSRQPEATDADKQTESQEQARPIDLAPLPEKLLPCSFILSSTLLQQRSLAREIEKGYPDADLLERDFSLPHSSAQEADLLLSPSTGLLLTTLQQIKQRALPGQREHSLIKERVYHLQGRYERLVVLISEGLSKDLETSGAARPVDRRDEEALAGFSDFTSTMEAEVLNEFVGGGEKALARATIIQMVRWGLPHGSKDIGGLKLLQDETHWELFLRRAGLNPFAAQIILASLKESYALPMSSSSPTASDAPMKTLNIFGLPAFLLMSAEERVQRFQALLGGSRILTRASALVDQQWISAAHGFTL